MAGWTAAGDNRWMREDDGRPDERHLLLHAGGQLVELHGTTVHAYTAAGEPNPDSPLSGVAWAGTWARPDLADAAVSTLWQAMGEYRTEQP